MEFSKVEIDDIERFRPYFIQSGLGICDYSIGGFFMWRDYYHMEYAIRENALFTRLFNKENRAFYNIPLGIGLKQGIDILKQELKQSRLSFCTIPECMIEEFGRYNPALQITEQVDFADYLYSSDDLRLLSGKKFSGQRNMIHQFLRENSNWEYVGINDENVHEAESFLLQNYAVSATASDFETEEESKVIEVLKNFDLYSFVGSLLKTDEKVVGFSLGEIIGDRVYIHIEKADRNVKGAYQMLVNQFAIRYTNDKIKYINREEDVGDLGLRESKKSYHPITLLKKYIVEV